MKSKSLLGEIEHRTTIETETKLDNGKWVIRLKHPLTWRSLDLELKERKKIPVDCVTPLERLLTKRRESVKREYYANDDLENLELSNVIEDYKKWMRIAQND